MSWISILKKPYEIERRFKYDDPTTTTGYREENFTSPYKELFQGVQGNETTDYWTYDIDEAVEYAFLGSDTGVFPRSSRFDETRYKFKDKGRPKVFHAKPTRKIYTLEHDDEYSDSGRGIEGRPHKKDPEDINRYIDDKDKKQVSDDKVIESAKKLLYDSRDMVMALFDIEKKQAKQHISSMLNKYFGADDIYNLLENA